MTTAYGSVCASGLRQPFSSSVGGVWGVPVRKARASWWGAFELWPFIERRPLLKCTALSRHPLFVPLCYRYTYVV